eukprot:1155308-Pelagomonas_calceolata.AAC.3
MAAMLPPPVVHTAGNTRKFIEYLQYHLSCTQWESTHTHAIQALCAILNDLGMSRCTESVLCPCSPPTAVATPALAAHVIAAVSQNLS